MSLMTYVNRYLELLTDPMFQRDEQGRELYFPAGFGSRGRIVPNSASSERIHLALRRGWLFMFLVLIPLMTAATLLARFASASSYAPLWAFIVLIAITIGLQLAFTFNLGRGLVVTGRRMTLKNQSKSIATTYSMRYIVVMIGLSIVLAGANGLAFVSPEFARQQPAWLQPLNAFGAIFFAAITLMWLRVAYTKRSQSH
jgi:hypothetical protein